MFDISLTFSRGDFTLQAALQLRAGGLHVLFGPSGSGKTTLLRLLAGLENKAVGHIHAPDGRNWLKMPSRLRPVGLMFQQHALFPHLSVRHNIAFGLRGKTENERVAMLLEAISLSHRAHCRPGSLSGGECQRVALARALAPAPQLLLLDEPFSSLDEQAARELQQLLKTLQQQDGFTVLMVTHNKSEAYRLADSVWLLDSGKVSGGGEPDHMLMGQRLSGRFQAEAEVCHVESDGLMARLEVRMEKRRFSLLVDESWRLQHGIEAGSRVLLTAKASDFSVFPVS